MAHWILTTVFRILAITACGVVAWQACCIRKRIITRELLARLDERERIARELHDTLLQGLFGLALSLQTSVDRLEAGNPVRVDLARAIDQSDAMMLQGRERIRDLRASHSDPKGLVTAFEAYGRQLQDVSSVQFNVSLDGEFRPLNPIVQEEIVLIGREALTNAFRHSEASIIAVEVSLRWNTLHVRVHDNGRGVEQLVLQTGARQDHWGLPNMRERASKIRGTLNIKLRAGGGTQVDLRVPGAVVYGSDLPHGNRLRDYGIDSFIRRYLRFRLPSRQLQSLLQTIEPTL